MKNATSQHIRATSISVTVLIFVLVTAAFISMFSQPLATTPIVFPPPLISRSQAESIAQGGGGRFLFQGTPTITSYLSTYHSASRILGITVGTDEANTLVWVVEVQGISTFFSPDPNASRQLPRQMRYILVIGLLGHPHVEMSK